MPFDVTKWKKTRADCAEGSGVAKAIKAWNSACPDDPGRIADDKLNAAGEAIKGFQEALATARGKCEKEKKESKDKLDATIELIDAWEKKASSYDRDYKALVKQRQDAAVKDAQAKNLEKLRGGVSKRLAHVPESLADIERKTSGFEAALKDGKLDQAYNLQGQASKDVRGLYGQISPAGFRALVKEVAKDLTISAREFSAADLMPAKTPDQFKKVQAYKKKVEGLEEQLDELEESQKDPEAGDARDPEYAKKLKEIIGDYDKVGIFCNEAVKSSALFLKNAKETEDTLADNRSLLSAATNKYLEKLKGSLGNLEVELKTRLESVRVDSGEIVKKAKKFGITDDDRKKYLHPRMNKFFSKNTRALTNIKEAQNVISDIEESGAKR